MAHEAATLTHTSESSPGSYELCVTAISKVKPDAGTLMGVDVDALNGPPVNIREEFTTNERSEEANSKLVNGDSVTSIDQSPGDRFGKAKATMTSDPDDSGVPHVAVTDVVPLLATTSGNSFEVTTPPTIRS